MMMLSVLKLRKLQRLALGSIQALDQPELVSRLAQLPTLQQLVQASVAISQRVSDSSCSCMAASAATVCELVARNDCDSGSRQGWEAIVNNVASSTNLAKLCLAVSHRGEIDSAEGAAEVASWNAPFVKLAGLTNLQELSMWGGSLVLAPGCALALAALTGLTLPALPPAGAGVGDEAATALAGSCQQLRHLDLASCNLVSMACLAKTVRHLTQLTELQLAGDRELMLQDLMLLTGLKRLRHLHVDRSAELTDEVVESFWAAVLGPAAERLED